MEGAQPGARKRKAGEGPGDSAGASWWKAASRKQQSACPPAAVGGKGKRATNRQPTVGVEGRLDLGRGSEIVYDPVAFPAGDARGLLGRLLAEVPWEQKEVFVHGRTCMQPRKVAYMGDPGTAYSYSRQTMEPTPWTPAVLEVKSRVEEVAGVKFNSVLLNLYRDGSDNMGWHADNESSAYGPQPVIGSATFGAERDFLLRRNDDHADKVKYLLVSGSVLVMRGTVQENWMHSLPKRAGVKSERVNLTFRNHLAGQVGVVKGGKGKGGETGGGSGS